MHCLCEFGFHWTYWILSGKAIWVLTSQHGQSLPAGKSHLPLPGREKVQRVEHQGSWKHCYHDNTESVGRAQKAYTGVATLIPGGGEVSTRHKWTKEWGKARYGPPWGPGWRPFLTPAHPKLGTSRTYKEGQNRSSHSTHCPPQEPCPSHISASLSPSKMCSIIWVRREP